MADLKKNQLNQIMFPMVDKTDFATVESGITASDFNSAATKKFFGVNHGVSDAFTSGTISKAATLVRSGIFQQTLKAAETNYDYLLFKFTHPSCADQILIFQAKDNDDSDIYSFLTGMSGMLSDVYSNLSDLKSDFQSRVPKAVATQSLLSDVHSDLLSYLAGLSSLQSDIYSNLSDLKSDFQSRVPKLVATNSQLSDLHSDLLSFLTVMSGVDSNIYSLLSDLHSDVTDLSGIVSDFYSDFQSRVPKRVATDSQLSDAHSDIKSAIAAITASVSASDISDIASAVWATALATKLVTLNTSDMSDIRSAIAAGPAATVTASDISDIASAVWAHTIGARVDSRVLVVVSQVSDIDSMLTTMSDILSDFYSDFQSRVPKAVATNSQLSDLHSDLRSYLTTMSGVQSDIYSNLAAGVTVGASSISDIVSAVFGQQETQVTGTPAANARFGDKFNFMFQAQRNKRKTNATKDIIYLDDGTTVGASAAISAITSSRLVRGEYT